MAFVLITDEELKNSEINTQEDSELDLESGFFCKDGWKFDNEFLSDDNTQYRRKYTTDKDYPISEIFLISNKSVFVELCPI